jgi:hypothetical protein
MDEILNLTSHMGRWKTGVSSPPNLVHARNNAFSCRRSMDRETAIEFDISIPKIISCEDERFTFGNTQALRRDFNNS